MTLSWAWPLIGPLVRPAACEIGEAERLPASPPVGLAMPFSQITASGSIFKILAARTLSSRIMSRTEFHHREFRAAKLTPRRPPVTKLKPIEAVIADHRPRLAVVDSELLGRHEGERRVAAADVGIARDHRHRAVLASHVGEDGSVTVISGNPDIGGSRASLALMAAEELGVRLQQVRPVIADTASIGFNFVTGGSRVTFATGLAVVTPGAT